MIQKWQMGLFIIFLSLLIQANFYSQAQSQSDLGVEEGETFSFYFEKVRQTNTLKNASGAFEIPVDDYGVNLEVSSSGFEGETANISVVDDQLVVETEFVQTIGVNITTTEGTEHIDNYQVTNGVLIRLTDYNNTKEQLANEVESDDSDPNYKLDYLEYIENEGIFGYNYSYDYYLEHMNWRYNTSIVILYERETGVLLYRMDNNYRLSFDETSNTTRHTEHIYYREGFSFPDSIDDYDIPDETTTSDTNTDTSETQTAVCTDCDTTPPQSTSPEPGNTSDSPLSFAFMTGIATMITLYLRKIRE